MDSNGVYSNVLGLEMSLHHPLQPRNPQNHHPMEAYGHHHLQTHQPPKQGYPSLKSKNQSLTLSDDDDPAGLTAENSADDGKRKMSPWQRMKWTDNMVRLLIMVVYYIGDEAAPDANDKKKGGGGALQKKGKWKSVSRAMMERGFYVSPQQCEDKFNDLNKRYKRVNDILGKGISCKVVENQSLLDSMDHISGKMKEEVKKLLNSKHLFFREMCAYHNSCGHGGSVEVEASAVPPQRCLHSSEEKSPVSMPNLNRGESKLGGRDDDEEEDDEGEEEDDDDDDDDEIHDRGVEEEDADERLSAKRMRHLPMFQQLDGEMTSILRDGSKSSSEKRMWMRTKMMALEEERVGIQSQSLELEKQRLKWLKFSSKKEREMEREKLMNERLRLENERMVLLIRRKDLDLLDQQQQQHSSKRSDHSITG